MDSRPIRRTPNGSDKTSDYPVLMFSTCCFYVENVVLKKITLPQRLFYSNRRFKLKLFLKENWLIWLR